MLRSSRQTSSSAAKVEGMEFEAMIHRFFSLSGKTLPQPPSKLRQGLLVFGLQLADWPKEPKGTSAWKSIRELGLDYANLLTHWQKQIDHSPIDTRAVIHQFLLHLNASQMLAGWDTWVGLVIGDCLETNKDQEPWPGLKTPLNQKEISPAQLLGSSIWLAREGEISAAILCLAWLEEKISKQMKESSSIRQAAATLLINNVLDSITADNKNISKITLEQWLAQTELCLSLQILTSQIFQDKPNVIQLLPEDLDRVAERIREEEMRVSHKARKRLATEVWLAQEEQQNNH